MSAKENTWVTENITPYALAPILSDAVGFNVPPQSMYQARRNGQLVCEVNELGHYFVTPENANAFIQAKLDRIAEKERKALEKVAEEVTEEVTTS